MKSIRIITPFDRHGHFRELQTLLPFVLGYTAKQFWGMVCMPNLKDPVTTWEKAKKYYNEIVYTAKSCGYYNFKPIMTAYLTDNTSSENLKYGFLNGIWKAVKLYPFGATTNSDSGVTKLENVFHIFEKMEEWGMPLLVHSETDVSRHTIPFIDRERIFTEEALVLINKKFPKLKLSVEHISTKEACQFVESCGNNVVGTITPQHLLYDHDAIFHNGIPPYKPGAYVENVCLPILKPRADVEYIKNAIMHGGQKHKFGAGTDTAPHTQEAKHSHGSCCGCFNSPAAVELYTMVFDEMGMFKNTDGRKIFEDFMSVNNLWIYGLSPSEDFIEVVREDQVIPEIVDGNIRPFKAGQTIPWKMY